MLEQLAWQGWLTIAVIVATLALLWERFTPDKVLAAAAAVLLFSGVLTPVQALAGFWNPGVLTVALLFVLVAALKTTGAIRWIGDWVLGRPRGEFHAQSRLVGIAAPLSAFINNTPIVAMMTSAVEHWSRRSGIAPSKLLMPRNYATILGRMCTLVGTSTNLIVAGLVLQTDGLAPLHMFTPLGVGTIAALAAGIYLLTLGRWLPDRRSALQQAPIRANTWSRCWSSPTAWSPGNIYEVDPLQCPRCGDAMRLVAFILERATIVRILSHLGEATDPPRLAAIRDTPEPARAAFAPEFELQAFDAAADVMPDDQDQRQEVA